MDKTVTTVETYGNTAAASIPLTLEKAQEQGKLRARRARDAVRVRRRPLVGRRALRLVSGGEIVHSHPDHRRGQRHRRRAGARAGARRPPRHRQRRAARATAEAVAARIRAAGGSAEARRAGRDLRRQRRGGVRRRCRGRSTCWSTTPGCSTSRRWKSSRWPSGTTSIQVMLVGAARLTRAVLPGMRERRLRPHRQHRQHPLAGRQPLQERLRRRQARPASASRGSIALETAGTDITINTICPSYVKTPLVDKQIADQARTRGIPESEVINEIMLKPMPKGVFIGIDELAGITAFLDLAGGAQHHRPDDRRRRRLDGAVDEAQPFRSSTVSARNDRAIGASTIRWINDL